MRLGRGKSGGGSRSRIFFTTDVHGSDVCFRKFLNAAKAYEAGTLILGGDITGKQLVPLVDDGTGRVTGTYAGEELVAEAPSERAAVMARLADAGHYSVICNGEELDALRTDPAIRQEVFARELLGRLERWMELADERLAGSGVRCLIQGGNDDFDTCGEIIDAAEHVEHPEDRIVLLDDGRELVSCGRANMTPWECPRDVPEEDLERAITMMAEGLERPERAVFNLHCPPVGTTLDEAPALGPDLKPRLGPGGMEMAHVGSTAVRSAIERWQPELSLHGHIHESRATARIGGTTCVNPGSEYGEGVLQGALIELDERGIRGLALLAG
jgi:Icc-related predicted phosphoesterase